MTGRERERAEGNRSAAEGKEEGIQAVALCDPASSLVQPPASVNPASRCTIHNVFNPYQPCPGSHILKNAVLAQTHFSPTSWSGKRTMIRQNVMWHGTC